MIIAADFWPTTSGTAAILDINRIEGGQRTRITSYAVANKREARKVAAAHNATPWNF